MLSGGYYGFRFVTPPPQYVKRFHHYRSNQKNIIASLLKFAGYIRNYKILPENIFGLNKIAATNVFSTFSKEFCWPSRAKGIIGRDLKFAGYVHHYKILTGNIFGLILKIKMVAMGVSLSVMKNAYISLIIGPRGLVCQASLLEIMAGNLLIWSDLTLDPSFKVKRGSPNLKLLITCLLLVLEVCNVKTTL